MFRGIHTNRKPPSALENFKVAVTEGSEIQIAISDIVKRAGFRIGKDHADGCITAVGALMTCYKKFGEKILERTLLVIRNSWEKDSNALEGYIIAGYASLLFEFEDEIDYKRLQTIIPSNYTPHALHGAAKSQAELRRRPMPDGVKEVLMNTYNRGRSKKKLISKPQIAKKKSTNGIGKPPTAKRPSFLNA